MQTEQPISGSPLSTRQSKSQVALQKQIRSLCGAANEQRVQGQYTEAEPLYLRALALAELVWGSDHTEVAAVCNNLAVLYKYTGKFDEAERLYRRALPLMEQSLGPE